jgi:hypothetical protein
MSAFEFVGQSANVGCGSAFAARQYTGALLRHRLSQYRENALPASAINVSTNLGENMKLGKVMGFLPTKDAKASRYFFAGKLGLRFVSDDTYALVMESNGTMIRIAKVQEFQPAPYTVLGWQV